MLLPERQSAQTLLSQLIQKRLTPRPPITPSEWADQNRIIRIGDAPGPWRTARTPYLREIMDVFGDQYTRRISIMKGSQTGGTEGIYNCIFWAIDRAPGLTMFVYPDAGSSRDQNNIRFLPTALGCPAIRDLTTGRAHDLKAGMVRFRTMTIVWRGSVNEHQLESFPSRYVFVDELDRCEPGTADLCAQRIKTYAGGKLVLNGKPSMSGVGIDREYQRGDQREYLVPCPHCGVYHARRWARIRWRGLDKDGRPAEDSRDVKTPENIARETAWFKCQQCNGRCGPEVNHWQLERGVWCPRGSTVSAMEEREPGSAKSADIDERWAGPGTLLNEGAAYHSHKSYHIPEWVSGLLPNPYAEGVEAYIAKGGQIDAQWVTDHDGRAWRNSSTSVEVGSLRRAIEADHAAGNTYRMGQVPPGVVVLLAAVDLQEAGAYVSVYGYSARGEHRYLVWREYVPCASRPGENALVALDHVLYKRRFLTENNREARIYFRCIDTGDRTDEVYDYLRQRANIVGARGVGMGGPRSMSMDEPVVWRRVDKFPNGTPIPGGCRVMRVHSDLWKRAVLRRLGIQAGDAEDDSGIDDISPGKITWHFPIDTPNEHLDHMTSEHFVVSSSGGKMVRRWSLKPGRRDNHDFDAACYAEALAFGIGVRTYVDDRYLGLNTPAAPVVNNQPKPPVREPRAQSRGLIARARERRSV